MERLPIRGGVNLHPLYYEDIVSHEPDIGWFAIAGEDYLALGGATHHYLDKIATRYPLSIQCSSLSVGSAESINGKHLQDLQALIQRYAPAQVSVTLAWCRWQGAYFVENLPLPYSDEALDQVAMNIRSVQNTFGRRVLIENPATLFALDGHRFKEGEFLSELVRTTGCGVALDLSNLYVSCQNTGGDPLKELLEYPLAAIKEIHISGHSLRPLDDHNILLIADRQLHIAKPLWQLLRDTLARLPQAVPTLVEWKHPQPELSMLLPHVEKVEQILDEYLLSEPGSLE